MRYDIYNFQDEHVLRKDLNVDVQSISIQKKDIYIDRFDKGN